MASISRSDLVAALAQQADVSKSTADAVLSAFGEFLTDAVSKGDKVSIPGIVSAIRVRGGVFNPGAGVSAQNQGSMYRVGNQFVGVGAVADIAEQLRLNNIAIAKGKKPF